MNPIKERLHHFIKYKGIAPASFERAAQLSNGVVNKMDVGLSKKSISLICSAFPDLNRIWLESGEGEMLNTPQQHAEEIEVDNSDNVGINLNNSRMNSTKGSGLSDHNCMEIIKDYQLRIQELTEQIKEKDTRIKELTDKLLGL